MTPNAAQVATEMVARHIYDDVILLADNGPDAIRRISEQLTHFAAQQVAEATRETWEAAATVWDTWRGSIMNPQYLVQEFRRRAQGGTP